MADAKWERGDVWESHPCIIVILNEVKNLVPRVLGWGKAKARGFARDEILHFVQNDNGQTVRYL
jgi:hypothetical protein